MQNQSRIIQGRNISFYEMHSHLLSLVLCSPCSQGEVIYWTFNNINPPNSYLIGKRLEKASGYTLDVTEGMASYSGYKDWFMQEFNKPGYTIEVGLGENPLPISQLDEIYKRVCPALLVAAESVKNLT